MSLENFNNFKKFCNKNILGVDYGTKLTGLASFNPGREPYPVPYGSIKYQNDEILTQDIMKIIDSESIDILILGIPYHMDGKSSEMTLKVKRFGELLESKINIHLYFQDETLTTYEAESRMKNSPQYNFKVDKNKLDSISASIILEDFIKS